MPENRLMRRRVWSIQAGRAAEGLCLAAQLCLRPSGRESWPWLPETAKIRNQSHAGSKSYRELITKRQDVCMPPDFNDYK